eukprot:TRINITY_DN3757_c0_g1_i1.p1 TRINITY_DN3757_c0_g1~~TRINITY_DN3757_c0_g1_i1.p1  ORF type:complete len:2077 (+),score=489.19 TRINITY_DN3757_c0_g1_i1:77-6307(+)
MGKGQRWKVVGGDAVAYAGPEDFARSLPESLPLGAVVEEQELQGNCLRFVRLSGRGPYAGWVKIKNGNADVLLKVEKKHTAPPAPTRSVQDLEGDLDGTTKRRRGSEKQRPVAANAAEQLQPPQSALRGRFWKVVGAGRDGLEVRQGVSESSPVLPGVLPQGAMVEEVQIIGNRLSFTDFSMRGPPSGWVNLRENGRDMLVPDTEGISPASVAEALKQAKDTPWASKHTVEEAPTQKAPLSGWVKLSEMYQHPLQKKHTDIAATAAETTDTAKSRAGRRRRVGKGPLPPLEDLADASEETLIEMLGFPEEEARAFVKMSAAGKKRVLMECRALIDMSPSERQGAFETLRSAWPKGPFPSFAKPSENLAEQIKELQGLPSGTCFPLNRTNRSKDVMPPSDLPPELASSSWSKGSLFAYGVSAAKPAMQKEALKSLAAREASAPMQPVPAADALAASERPDYCRPVGDRLNREKLVQTIITRGRVNPADAALYLTEEMRKRPVMQDSGPGHKLHMADLSESDYRGERAKVLRDSASQLGNVDLLSLSKPNLVLDTHKDYLKAGVDICCTNTLSANSLAQKDYKTTKLVFEMNRASALLAKRAAAEATKQDPHKPRLVAGAIGPNSKLLAARPRSATWEEMVEAYQEQIRGLAEGGVDLLALEAVTDAISAKAAIYAIFQVYQQIKQRSPPVLITAVIDPSTGCTPGGQTADAFFVSVKHAKPLVVGLTTAVGSAACGTSVQGAYEALATLSLCFCGLRPAVEATGQVPNAFSSSALRLLQAADGKGLPNIVGAGPGVLPIHVAALLQALQATSAKTRALPSLPEQPALLTSAHEVHAITRDSFNLVGNRCVTFSSGKFKQLIDDYLATNEEAKLKEALEVCAAQVEKGADVLDICVDGLASDGTFRPRRGVMKKVVELCDSDSRLRKVPLMLCSSDWRIIREGLRNTQGRCIVNSICLMLGEEEFLRIARECLKHGAAVVVMAVGAEGRAVTFKDKVNVLQRSYQLLRQKLDYPPEDIILDCHLTSIRPDEHSSDVIAAVGELRRVCPQASLAVGLSNISAPFGRLQLLREAMHSVFLQHAVPKGLNIVLADPGHLPVYSSLESEMLKRCEEVILHSAKDAGALKRFMAFFGFGSGMLVCLPVNNSMQIVGQDAWWELPECKTAAKAAQGEYLLKRGPLPTPELQKATLQSLKPALSPSAQLKPGSDPCRISHSGGAAALQQQVSTALASRTVLPVANLLAQLNTMLQQKVLVMDGPLGPALQLKHIQDEVSFRGSDGRFPASAKGNYDLLSITKPDLVLSAHRELLAAGADIIRTNTHNGDVLSQKVFGTEDVTYELNKAAALLAKQAAAEAVSQNPQRLRFVAGVLGPSICMLSGSAAAVTWDAMVQSYMQQVRGLVEGGVDLILLDSVSDTLNAKAAVYAIEQHFAVDDQKRLPLLINVMVKDCRTSSGQSLAACLASLRHAKALAFGVFGDGSSALDAVRDLAELCSSWVLLTGETCTAAASSSANIISPSLSRPQDVQDFAKQAQLRASPPRALPSSPVELRLSGLEVLEAGPSSGLKLVGQRCNLQGSARFQALMDAHKYGSTADTWDAALELCARQVEDGADILDFNLDSKHIDSQWAMGKLVRLCAAHPVISKLPFVISSVSWPVISEGLKNTQGKCIVNGISTALSDEEFLRLASECKRFGAAVIVLAFPQGGSDFPSYEEKVSSCQRAYNLLRSKLDFPPEDIIFDCMLTPIGCEGMKAGPRDFMDAVAAVKGTCPGVSCIGGLSNLSLGFRPAKMLRSAVTSVFLQQAVPKGLDLAFVEVGQVPRFSSIEEPTKGMLLEVMANKSADGAHVNRLLSFAAYLSGSAAAEEARKKPRPRNTLKPKDEKSSALVLASSTKEVPPPTPAQPSPQFTNPIETLVQATGTISSSIFQTYGSKAHAAANFHRMNTASTINKTIHFSSISVYMGQGGSGPITGASSLMDGLTLWERHQGINQYSNTILWGAIGEIGLRKAIYGSRDVFAQFDLGQKLIGPQDTAFLMKQVCCNFASWDFIGLAYLDSTWKDTLTGETDGGGLGGRFEGRKTFLDN